MVDYTPDGYLPESPFVLSNGEYKMNSGFWALIGIPLADQHASDSSDYNKRYATRYTDTLGISGVIGVPLKNKPPTSYAYADLAGNNDMRKDVLLAHAGGLEMKYCGTTNPYPALMPIAPHPSGYQEWAPGKFLMGYTLTYAWTGGIDNKVYINCIQAPRLKIKDEKVYFDGLFIANTSFAPTLVHGMIVSGSVLGVLSLKAVSLVPSGVTYGLPVVTAVSGAVSVAYVASSGLKIHPDCPLVTGFIRYEYWDTW